MQTRTCGWIACVSVLCTGVALAAPKVELQNELKRAKALNDGGDYDQALAVIDQALASAPSDLDLLALRAAVLLDRRDYIAALAAYQAYLKAGPTSGNRRKALKIVNDLDAVRSTFLEITVTNGPAAIYLDSRTQGQFCLAEPSCKAPLLPREYKLIAERSGFERWAEDITVAHGKVTLRTITLVEKPSQLTVRVTPAAARVSLDGAAYDAPTTVAAGRHSLAVSLAGHMDQTLEVAAHEGKPVELNVVLTPLVPTRSEPPGAALFLDGKPIAIRDGTLAIPPGPHVLLARAPGYRDRRFDIPAVRHPDFKLAVELDTLPEPLTSRRNLALMAVGATMVTAVGGAVLLNNANENDDLRGFRRGAGYTFCALSGISAVGAVVLWVTAPRLRVAVTPRVDGVAGGVAGLDIAMRF